MKVYVQRNRFRLAQGSENFVNNIVDTDGVCSEHNKTIVVEVDGRQEIKEIWFPTPREWRVDQNDWPMLTLEVEENRLQELFEVMDGNMNVPDFTGIFEG